MNGCNNFYTNKIMDYYSYTDKELIRACIQPGEIAVYTGAANPLYREAFLSNSLNHSGLAARVYVWRDDMWKNNPMDDDLEKYGGSEELDCSLQTDEDGVGVMDVQAGEERYRFLFDYDSGYLRQIDGPARPVVVANLGGIPLRVDTFLGKFEVNAGSILRLYISAPRRRKRKVLLTFGSRAERPLESAEIWDDPVWRPLNIVRVPCGSDGGPSLIVRDGCTVVQYMSMYCGGGIHMADSPEPDPDYDIYVTGRDAALVKLRFGAIEYRNGLPAQKVRTLTFSKEGSKAYPLKGVRDSLAHRLMERYAVSLRDLNLPGKAEPCGPGMSEDFPD